MNTTPLEALRAALFEIETYFAERSDVIDGDYSQPAPNEEMRMLDEVHDAQRACHALVTPAADHIGDASPNIELSDTPYGRGYTTSWPPMEMPVGRYWFGPSPRPDEQATTSCYWYQDASDGEGTWTTGCENMFTIEADSPSENKMKFCCYCGGLLVEVSLLKEDAEDEDDSREHDSYGAER